MPAADAAALNDVREVNLSYLMLAQRLLRENRAAGMFRLGVDAQVAEILVGLSPTQILRLAGSSSVLYGFRLNDAALLAMLTREVLGGSLQQAHSAILLADQGPAGT